MNTKEQIELLDSQKKDLIAKGNKARETSNFKELKTITDQIVAKTAEIENLKSFDEIEKASIVESGKENVSKTIVRNGFVAMANAINTRGAITNDLITGGESGEDLLVPVDVQLQINTLRKSYRSARDIVNVVTATTLSGSYNWEDKTNLDTEYLSDFTDGGTIANSGQPKFIKKDWKITFKGQIIPISRILVGAEQASLMTYLNDWFVKKAIITENRDIFAKLKESYNGGTPKAIVGFDALKTSVNVDLDVAAWVDGAIVTNQNGFNYLDHLKDGDGKYVLQPDPKNSTQKLLFGYPVIVFSNSELPDVESTHPFFLGSTKAGVKFREYNKLTFETSKDFLFNKNQLALKVMEGYTVQEADTTAYIYALVTEETEA